MFHQEFGDVETDAAGTDDGDFRAHRMMACQHIEIAQHARVIVAREIDGARRDAGGYHHVVVSGIAQRGGRRGRAQLHVDPGIGQLMSEIAQGLVKLLLARDLFGVVELAADFSGLLDQRHRMAALAQRAGTCHARRAGTDHGNAFARGNGLGAQFGFVTGAGVHQATGALVLEHVVEAGLVAGDARIDAFAVPGLCLVRPGRIGQQRPRHGDHVRFASGKNAFGHLGHVDAVGGDQRNRHLAFQFPGDPGETGAGHAGDDGGHTRFMPADAGIDDAGSGRLDGLGQRHDFIPLLAALDQVEHRQAIDDDEVATDRLARAPHDLDRQAHPALGIAAPGIVAVVGAFGDELVDQIAFRTHHFHAVVTGFPRQPCATDEVVDGVLDASRRQRARGERRDR